MRIKIITIFIVGAAVLSAAAVFSADDYNSSRSNTSISVVNIPIANKHVGDILLRYGIGGAEINEVTDALARGISTVDLRAMLVRFGVSDPGIQEVLTKLDELGAGADSATKESAGDGNAHGFPDRRADSPEKEFTSGAVPAPAAGKNYNESKSNTKSAPAGETQIEDTDGNQRKVSAPSAGDTPQSKSYIKIQGIPGKKIELMQNTIGKIQERLKGCDTKVCITVGDHAKSRADVTTEAEKAIKDGRKEEAIQSLLTVKKIVEGDIELLAAVEDKGLIADVLGLERALLHQTDSALSDLQRSALLLPAVQKVREPAVHEAAKALRDNFRENVETTIGHVDHGKTARIAVAHGKGLRMLNRYRSAMARFDHILGRLELRILKLEAQGIDTSSTAPLIEKAKSMSVENEAKMEELKAKYESLLLGENVGGVAEEARAIAAELKTDIENLRAIIIEVHAQAADDYNSSRSNTSI
ncbi:MAG: hypothetical protein HY458_00870 [Parcubacteria group bacterium]|nr:hypothetical protein [Parcubacteria group bacterium]